MRRFPGGILFLTGKTKWGGRKGSFSGWKTFHRIPLELSQQSKEELGNYCSLFPIQSSSCFILGYAEEAEVENKGAKDSSRNLSLALPIHNIVEMRQSPGISNK